MTPTTTVPVAPAVHASLLHSIFAVLEKALSLASDPVVVAMLPAKYQGYVAAIGVVDQVVEGATAPTPAASIIAPPGTVALVVPNATTPTPGSTASGPSFVSASLPIVNTPVVDATPVVVNAAAAPVTQASRLPGSSIPSATQTTVVPIVAAPVAETIAQYLAGPALRDAPPPPIGEGSGLPGEVPVYTYQPLFPGTDFNKLPLNTTIGEAYDGGAITMAEVEAAFGAAGEAIDRSNPLFNTNLLAYGWPSVLNAHE